MKNTDKNKTIFELIAEGKGADAASSITERLNQKLKLAIQEELATTAQEVYGLGESFQLAEEAYGVLDSYDQAHKVKDNRTDWKDLPTKVCKNKECGQKFRQEVKGQNECRDCHSMKKTGFYTESVTIHDLMKIKEAESGTAGIEGRINYIKKLIEKSGDPGGTRRAALKKLEAQLHRGK